MRLASDTRLRKRLFVDEAMSHPAKGHLGLWEAIIEKYTEPGETILDPMAGVGGTLMAALMGRNVICVELEHHFLLPMVRSWAKMRQHPMLGASIGQVDILWGDARAPSGARLWPYTELALQFPKDSWTALRARRRKFKLPLLRGDTLPLSSADSIITSPPYQNQGMGQGNEYHPERMAGTEIGLGRGYTRPVDAVVSSPPYANRLADTYVDDDPQRMSYEMGKAKIDATLFSPPFEQADSHKEDPRTRASATAKQGGISYTQAFHTDQNIGNLKGQAYWDDMKLVYQECHRVLKPGGIMALVLGGFTRKGLYIDLPSDTMKLCTALGFEEYDHWLREKWSLSFWRILQKKKGNFSEELNYEHVWVFKKPLLGLG